MIDAILEHYPDEDIVYANGFDDAIVGIESTSMRLVYAVPQCIDILVESGMPYEEALEFFDFNVRGAYVGERTPIWMDQILE